MISKFFPWFGEAPRDPAARTFSHHGSCPVTLASRCLQSSWSFFPPQGPCISPSAWNTPLTPAELSPSLCALGLYSGDISFSDHSQKLHLDALTIRSPSRLGLAPQHLSLPV